MHIFYILTGYHYFFCQQLVAFLEIEKPIYICNFNREQDLLVKIKKDNSHVIDYCECEKDIPLSVFRAQYTTKNIVAGLPLDRGTVNFYAPYYVGRHINFFISALSQNSPNAQFHLYPDAIGMMIEKPDHAVKKQNPFARLLTGLSYTNLAPQQNYAPIFSQIYHFPAPRIYADPTKITIVPINGKQQAAMGKDVLLLGGQKGASAALFAKAKSLLPTAQIFYKPHPQLANNAQEIALMNEAGVKPFTRNDKAIEQLIHEEPYEVIAGSFSSLLVFSKLFCSQTTTYFLFDANNEKDQTWKHVADSMDIELVEIAE